MFKFVAVFATCLAVAAAGIVHPASFVAAPAAVAYANAPLYAAGGSQQIDVRHNYDGSLSSYTTTPFGYTSPFSSRYVAGSSAVPAAFASQTTFTGPAPYALPAGYAATAPYAASAPLAAAYPAPYVAGYSAPLTSPFAAAPAKFVL